jgi:uncharacterized protein DUF6527
MTITSYTPRRYEFGDNRPIPAIGEIQVIYQDGKPYAVDFLCPCGCGSTCFTPVCSVAEKQDPNTTDRNKNRCWGYDPNTVTIIPSIRYLGGCKAHFNITNGKVIIHADSGK